MKCRMTWINLFQFHPLNLDFLNHAKMQILITKASWGRKKDLLDKKKRAKFKKE